MGMRPVRSIAEFWRIFAEGVKAFFRDEAPSRGAAIAFYTTTAMGPVLYISAWLAGLFVGSHAAHARLVHEIQRLVDRDTAQMLQDAIAAAGRIHGGILPTLVGAIVLVFTSGGVFVEVQWALNRIWKTANPPFTTGRLLRTWCESVALVLGLGVFLCASLLLNTMIGALGAYFERLFGIGGWLAAIMNFCLSASLIAVLFGTIYKVLPNRELQWRDVAMGAAVTTALILVGEYLIAFYLAATALGHRYGSAGGAIAFLMWIYYSVQVFLLGAEFTKSWAMRHGSAAARAAAHGLRLDQAA